MRTCVKTTIIKYFSLCLHFTCFGLRFFYHRPAIRRSTSFSHSRFNFFAFSVLVSPFCLHFTICCNNKQISKQSNKGEEKSLKNTFVVLLLHIVFLALMFIHSLLSNVVFMKMDKSVVARSIALYFV